MSLLHYTLSKLSLVLSLSFGIKIPRDTDPLFNFQLLLAVERKQPQELSIYQLTCSEHIHALSSLMTNQLEHFLVPKSYILSHRLRTIDFISHYLELTD